MLVGLPGAGKTTVGRAVAERLGWPFVDLDAEVEARSGRSVARIFADGGEAYFRDIEHSVTLGLADSGAMVVATGGGWVTRPENVDAIRERAVVVWLRVSPATALSRLRQSGLDDRPLLAGDDPAGELASLATSREAAYAAADHVVDAELLDLQEVVRMVAALADA